MPPTTAKTEADSRPHLPIGRRPTSPTNGAIWQGADRYSWAFAAISGASIVAGGLVAAINSATPFAHGSWVAAYLVLVGGVAQLLLGVGCVGLPVPRLSPRLRSSQLALWNVGNAIVVGGVLVDAVAVVAVGSVVLLGSLGGFAVGGGPIRRDRRARLIIYRLVILGLAVSVVIGAVMANGSSGA